MKKSKMGYFKYLFTFIFIAISTLSFKSIATPRDYKSFKREQSAEYTPSTDELIRVWMFYVGQGDAVLIQIPESLSNTKEPVDILVDTGAYRKENQDKALKAIQELYPDKATIEHIVISHHDSDHVKGLPHLADNENYTINYVWHNGLASYSSIAFNLDDSKILKEKGIYKNRKSTVTRFMAFLEEDEKTLQPQFLINNLADLKKRQNKNWYQGVYKEMATTILNKNKPFSILNFNRAYFNSPFIEIDNTDISLFPIWPKEKPEKYGDWGETINGNSLSFNFTYKDFSMVFTGDLNEKSQPELIKYLNGKGQIKQLQADVLKVPHHGSKHTSQDFFNKVSPVVGIASMGKKGFESNWKHPAEDVVKYLKGSHRLYSTYIHEKKFSYDSLQSNFSSMQEINHILIETDGKWFRIVEIPYGQSLNKIPSIKEIKTGNGTQWIKAK